MSDDDPFAEPGDTERTVVKPTPANRRRNQAAQQEPPPQQPQPAHDPMAEPMAAPPQPQQEQAFGVPNQGAAPKPDADGARTIQQAMTGMNRLNACASTLFLLISRIRNRAQHMDPDALRQSVVAEVRAFESRALQAGIDASQVRVARYAICATLDDVVLNTPWGGQSTWTTQSMVSTFHKEVVGGDRFFDLLSRLEAEPANNIDMLEFLYQCLSLGFEGRLRVEQGGQDRHLQIRNGLARIIRAQRGPVEQDLSPTWKGANILHKPRSAWGLVWIVTGVLAVILTGLFATLYTTLDSRTERALGLISGLTGELPATLARRAPPAKPTPLPPTTDNKLVKVQTFLEPEIKEGLVEVFGKGNTLLVRMVGTGMFASGSEQLTAKFRGPIERVAKSLNGEAGSILIAGHTDSRGSDATNQRLSRARAKSVGAIFTAVLTDPSRVRTEGRGEKEPIASNESAAGRAANRRIEIILIPGGN